MSFIESHAEWLSLIEISGPFLAVPVLKEVFPQGLEQLDVDKRKRLRQAYEEWREALENDDPRFPELHQAWIAEVLDRGLELDEDGRGDVLKRSTAIPDKLIIDLPEYGVKLAPDATVVDEQSGNALMLIQTFPVHTDLETTSKRDGWASSPAERMVQLCRQTGCRLGLLTNGERWLLVDAPVGAVTTFASWYARLWGQEPVTLQAFVHLLGIRRFFVDDSERLPALFDRSLKHQDEVTDALGEQVRRAVEVLIQALDKADLDRDRTLLAGVSTTEIYEAALTVMMRLVFLLSAEERGLLLLGDERYEAHYALSTLRMQLRADSAEILERRWDAWSRLLALFRAVYGGIEHENLRMPALGGSLFDPDRFPFLEGRDKHSQWRTDPAKPLPIDNRTVLLLLDAIQQFQGRTLSYRALDVEQIGYVYEGLLERTVKRAKDVTLELDATKNAKSPWVTLTELETARKAGDEKLADLLRERSGSSASRIRNDLAKAVDDVLADKLLTACHADVALRDRIKPYANLLRVDPWGYPLVYPTGSFMVTTGSDRRETGTHYTPKSLTEAIVTETLTPVAYVGPAEGKPREEWQLKSAAELLDLKICDPAMGSGAFLVQVCRWLAERLTEAWNQAESAGKYVTVDGEVRESATNEEPLPRDNEERSVIARRLIAERCLYGVDLNPLAVELAKLSIWLVTLAKGRPFGFLDHNLRCGDSLLGIHRLDQLTELRMTPGQKNTQMRIFGRNIEQAVTEAVELRKRLRQMPIRDIHDVEAMARLDVEAKAKLEAPERIADALIAEVFKAGGSETTLNSFLITLSIEADQYLQGDNGACQQILQRVSNGLSADLPTKNAQLKPFHWPLEFPEVFFGDGFDAVVGNPPFSGGKKISTKHGSAYRQYLFQFLANKRKGSADLCVYFLLRNYLITSVKGFIGIVASDTISIGDSKKIGLDWLINNQHVTIYSAHQRETWGGSANVNFVRLQLSIPDWKGLVNLNGKSIARISSDLDQIAIDSAITPVVLKQNTKIAFAGSYVYGTGFVLSKSEADQLIRRNPDNAKIIKPYLRGEDFNSDPEQQPQTFVIDFEGRSFTEASKYPDCLSILTAKVKPERDLIIQKGGQIHEYDYWKFWDARLQSYERIKPLGKVLFHSQTFTHIGFSFVPSSWVFAFPHLVFGYNDYSNFSILQSSVHGVWVMQYGNFNFHLSPQYSLRNCFDKFPFPQNLDSLEKIGETYYKYRQRLMLDNQQGLTQTYNRFNDQCDLSDEISRLRGIHIQIDNAVTEAYGWSDLSLEHGFHATKQGMRFTMSENSRREVISRLCRLNNQRYQEEVDAGLHRKSTTKTKSIRSSKSKASTVQVFQTSLFDAPVPSPKPTTSLLNSKTGNSWGSNASDQILAWLEAHKGWFNKSAILNGCGTDPNDWASAIDELLKDEFIESQGDEDSRRYRTKS